MFRRIKLTTTQLVEIIGLRWRRYASIARNTFNQIKSWWILSRKFHNGKLRQSDNAAARKQTIATIKADILEHWYWTTKQ